MSKQVTVQWPPLNDAYTDEFGDINSDVYQAAGSLWPEAARLAEKALGDPAAGQDLLLKAAAAVTRVRDQQGRQIDHLESYLFQTYKRLILGQLSRERVRRQLELAQIADRSRNNCVADEDLERMLFVKEVMKRMDKWTLKVLRLLLLDYSYKEIGSMVGLNPHATRIKFRRRCQSIVERIGEEVKTAG